MLKGKFTKANLINILRLIGFIFVLWLILDNVLPKPILYIIYGLIALFCVYMVFKSIPLINMLIESLQKDIWGKPLKRELWTEEDIKNMRVWGFKKGYKPLKLKNGNNRKNKDVVVGQQDDTATLSEVQKQTGRIGKNGKDEKPK